MSGCAMQPKFPSLKAWKESGARRHGHPLPLKVDPEMTEAARQARIAAAEESARADADMLAEHVKRHVRIMP